MHVIIIGAGIGGLCTAIALQKAGIDFTLYEKSPNLRASGAGISVWPNATRVLKDLGILDKLLPQGELIQQTQIQSDQGQVLTGLDLTAFEEPTFCIQRSRLQTTLADQIPEHSIHLDHALSAITQDETGVTIHFENGVEAKADVLVAADGIYSTARSLLWDVPDPKYQGYMAWRGILKQSLPEWTSGLALQYWGRGKRFGLLSMGPNQMYWFASLNSPTPEADVTLAASRESLDSSPPNLKSAGAGAKPVGQISRKDYLTQCFQDWNSRVQDAIALTDESDLIVRPIETAPRLKSWHQGRVLLMGDAAHAMTPNLGQGACMAIEDAATLAQSLTKNDTISQALAAYERHRRPRVSQVVLRSYLLGKVGQIECSALTSLRGVGLRLAPQELLRLSFQTLFRYRSFQ